MTKSTRKIFTVEGSGQFPFDMLRFDHAWPYTESGDSHLLSDETRERRRVVLATDNPQAPTEGRWESFGWKVIGIGEHRSARFEPEQAATARFDHNFQPGAYGVCRRCGQEKH